MNIPTTQALLARPIWRRYLRRASGATPGYPSEEEKRDAIAVLAEVEVHDGMLSVDAMMVREATMLLDEYGQ